MTETFPVDHNTSPCYNEGVILDNCIANKSALSTLHKGRKSPSCHVTLVFPAQSNPAVKRDIARMLLTAY